MTFKGLANIVDLTMTYQLDSNFLHFLQTSMKSQKKTGKTNHTMFVLEPHFNQNEPLSIIDKVFVPSFVENI